MQQTTQKVNQLKPYPKYKDSGVEWLGDVPEQWRVVPLCSLAKVKNVIGKLDRELLSVYLNKGVIRFNSVKEKRTNVTSQDLSKYQAVDPKDLVLNNQQAWRGSVGVSKYKGIVSPAYLVLSLDQSIDPDFANEVFRDRSMVAQYLINSKGVGSIQRNLYWPHLKRIPVFIPSSEEQTLIVRYLNFTNSRITKFIAAKKQLIKLLEEQKQAIIHQAVTGAIDVRTGKPYPKYKDTADELVRVPWDWNSSKIKYVCSIHNGSDHKSIETDTGYPVIGSGGQFSYASRYIYDKESVLFGRKGTIDKPLYMDQPFWTVDTMFYTKIYKNIFPKYLYYIAKTIPYQFYSTQTALPSMTQTILGNFRIGLPSIESQKNIVDFIEQELFVIDQTIDHAKKEIDLVKEYRIRLTADVVTGKVDVREIAKNLPDSIEPIIDEVEGDDVEEVSSEDFDVSDTDES